MTLVFLEKPTTREGIPAYRNNPTALGFNLVRDPALIDEVHDDSENDTGRDGPDKKMQAIHSQGLKLQNYFISTSQSCRKVTPTERQAKHGQWYGQFQSDIMRR
jgi:hypothetical protein